MRDLRSELLRSDPVAREVGPSPADFDLMRRRILSSRPVVTPRRVGPRLVLALVLSVVAVNGALVTRSRLSLGRSDPPRDALVGDTGGEVALRQVQYRTPGGTRVFWTLNPNLEVR